MLIGIDLGTSTCKAIAVSPVGEVVAVASADYPMINRRAGWAEQEPSEWWRATGEAITALTAQLPEHGREVVAIGLCGQMHGLTPLDADGEDRKSTRLNSSHVAISYAVFCLKKE